jgi:DNA polymerase-3 subunit gamma/tau
MEYRVLARKYRPSTFADLIGQEAMVRTLTNAIASRRIAHAFLLTGIRGIGKTTSARIIARALNCIGADGKGGPTASPCGVCENCRMIAEDRHVDILEMDAASHTGVDDIRSIIDTVRYAPASARYKIYIIDEVHMLSGNAFNALLKTLEEPPPHVKFIFATTESRKIPVTVLSRCQRFDLKRIPMEMLVEHLGRIAEKENIAIDADALKLIALVAEGSVRDALSLLDQASSHAASGAAVTAAAIRAMIGSADNTATFRMLESLLKGDMAATLAQVQARYTAGSDPLWMVQDALEAVHLITRVKVSSEVLADVTLSPHDRESANMFAEKISMPVLARLWQMLMKGLSEVRMAPQPMAALEMLMVRIAYAAQLPTPADVIRTAPDALSKQPVKPNLEIVHTPSASPQNFVEVIALFEKNREAFLAVQLKQVVRLVSFAQGKLEICLAAQQSRDFPTKIAECLTRWTGQKWNVILSDAEGEPTLAEQEAIKKEKREQTAATDPLVASVLEQFPGAKLVGIKEHS